MRREGEGKQQTGRKREGVSGGEGGEGEKKRGGGAEEKFSFGNTQMSEAEWVNDWAGGSRDKRQPLVF